MRIANPLSVFKYYTKDSRFRAKNSFMCYNIHMKNKAKRAFTIGTYTPVKVKSNRARYSGILRYMAEHPDHDVNLVEIAN